MIVRQLTGIDLRLSKRVADAQNNTVQFQHTVSRQNAQRIDKLCDRVISIRRQQSLRGDNIAAGSLRKTLARAWDENLFVIH